MQRNLDGRPFVPPGVASSKHSSIRHALPVNERPEDQPRPPSVTAGSTLDPSTSPFCKSDLLFTKSDLLFTKRDLLFTKRDLLFTKRDLLFTKRDLSYCKRGISGHLVLLLLLALFFT